MSLNDLSRKIIGCAIQVHSELGPGFLESVYRRAMEFELREAGVSFEREKFLPVHYKSTILDVSYRCDFIVEDSIILECKAVKDLTPIVKAQLLNYLKISGRRLGLVLNFNVMKMTDGIMRIVNNFDDKHG
jgi:GxxExxY protein